MPLLYQRPDWQTAPESLTLVAKVSGKNDALALLAEVFSLIEECGLPVARVELPATWRPHLPIEEGFLWGAWVDDVDSAALVVARSPVKAGVSARSVIVAKCCQAESA
jgi:hypothetical protein